MNRERKRVLLLGAGGMLGQDIMTLASEKPFADTYQLFGLTRRECDITREAQLRKACDALQPHMIINTAAYTAVDACEEQKEDAFKVNGEAVGTLARLCAGRDILCVHFSTDYVFNGKSAKHIPWKEDDATGPLNVYGASKSEGEKQLRESGCQYLLLRTSWLFGTHGNCFPSTMLKLAEKHRTLKVVDDQHGSPSFTEDVARGMFLLLQKNARGTFHLCNAGRCSWHQFASALFKEFEKEVEVLPVSSAEFPRPAQRPAWSVMDISRYEEITGETMPPWEDALRRYKERLCCMKPSSIERK